MRALSFRTPGPVSTYPTYPSNTIGGWVNWSGSDATINNSFNVSSITDNGAGDFTVNWRVPFNDANYAISNGGGRYDADTTGLGMLYFKASESAFAAGSVRVHTTYGINANGAELAMASLIAVGNGGPISTEVGLRPSATYEGVVGFWINFNGSGTPAINGAHNVSSITDNGTSDYTLNFATALNSAEYLVTGVRRDAGNAGVYDAWAIHNTTGATKDAVRMLSENYFEGTTDPDLATVIGFLV